MHKILLPVGLNTFNVVSTVAINTKTVVFLIAAYITIHYNM